MKLSKNYIIGNHIIKAGANLREKKSQWLFPSKDSLLTEYNVEYKNHIQYDFGQIFPTFSNFYDVCLNSPKIEITPGIDSKIYNRSHTQNYEELINLISSYRSYPIYRNEKTVTNLYDRVQSGKSLDMPIILKYNNKLYIMSGNTRMDIAFQNDVNPICIVIDIDRVSSLKEAKQVGIIYHYTHLLGFKEIIKSGGFFTKNHDFISFSRNYNLENFGEFRFAIDGDSLSNRYHVEPYLDTEYNIERTSGEYEERVLWTKGKILPILKYVLQIDILKSGWKRLSQESQDEALIGYGNLGISINLVNDFKPVRK